MAFFTRVNSNVPVLPPEDLGADSNVCSTATHTHRRYASEPVTTISAHNNYVANSTTRPNSVPSGSSASSSTSKSGSVTMDRNVTTITISASVDEDIVAATNINKSVNTKGRPESSPPGSTNSEGNTAKSTEKSNNGNGEPKRYEYVVDRVLGVEV